MERSATGKQSQHGCCKDLHDDDDDDDSDEFDENSVNSDGFREGMMYVRVCSVTCISCSNSSLGTSSICGVREQRQVEALVS